MNGRCPYEWSFHSQMFDIGTHDLMSQINELCPSYGGNVRLALEALTASKNPGDKAKLGEVRASAWFRSCRSSWVRYRILEIYDSRPDLGSKSGQTLKRELHI